MASKRKAVIITQDASVSTGYIPRSHQYALHLGLKRFNVLLCHRRLGKTVFALNVLIDKALRCTLPMPRYAYIAPTFAMAKRIAWDYLKAYTDKIPSIVYNEAELRCDFPNGARIQLLSAENPMSLKGTYNDFVVLDEYALMNPIVWREAVRPTLSDRAGGCLFISTVKGMNHFWELYEYARDMNDPEWYSANLKASETHIIPAAELASARLSMTEEEYAQEYENDPMAGLVGAYFAKELTSAEREGRIGDVKHDPQIPVDLSFDLGFNDTTVAWFSQTSKTEHRMINYFEVSGSSIPETIQSIKKIADSQGYNLDYWILPHDAKVRDLSTGRARIQEFYRAGVKRLKVVPRVGAKMESISAARVMFKKCWFDRKNCAQGLKGLANYQRKFDSKNNTFQENPLHNWASNCFTFDTLVQTRYGKQQISSLPKTGEVLTICGWKQYRNPRITKKNAQLVAVVFKDGSTVKCTPDHLFLTTKGWKSAKTLPADSLILSRLTPIHSILTDAYIVYGKAQEGILEIKNYFIETFGKMRLAQSQAKHISTIKMGINAIIDSAISNVSQKKSTYQKIGMTFMGAKQSISQKKQERERQIGTNLNKEFYGINGKQVEKKYGSNGKERLGVVRCATRSLKALSAKTLTSRFTVLVNVGLPQVKNVEFLENKESVWDITVPGVECFSLGNGAIVHNCADAFQCFAMGVREDVGTGLEDGRPERYRRNDEQLYSETEYDVWERN